MSTRHRIVTSVSARIVTSVIGKAAFHPRLTRRETVAPRVEEDVDGQRVVPAHAACFQDVFDTEVAR